MEKKKSMPFWVFYRFLSHYKLFTSFCHKIDYIYTIHIFLGEGKDQKKQTKRLNDQHFVDQQAFWFAVILSLLLNVIMVPPDEKDPLKLN